MLQELGFHKVAILNDGLMLITYGESAKNPYEDYDANDIKRFQRKLQRKKLPIPARMSSQLEVSDAVDRLRKSVDETHKELPISFNKSRTIFESRFDPNDYLFTTTSPSSMIAGHELGHAFDFNKDPNKFSRAFASKKNLLELERSASNNILSRLSPQTQRLEGNPLAIGYQGYLDGLGKRSFKSLKMPNFLNIADKKAVKLLTRNMQNHHDLDDDYGRISNKALDITDNIYLNNPRPKAYSDASRITNNVLRSAAIRRNTTIRQFDQNASAKAAKNKDKVLKELSNLDPQRRTSLLRQAAREVREARKAFGPHVAAGVRDNFRSIIKEVAIKAARKGK